MTLQEARQLYKETFGKLPGPRWPIETVLDKIKGKDATKDQIPSQDAITTKTEDKTIDTSEVPKTMAEMKQEEWEKLSEEERMSRAKKINEERIETIDQFEELAPVFINGEAFCIIDEKYVPYKEAQIIRQKEIVRRETAYLKSLTNS